MAEWNGKKKVFTRERKTQKKPCCDPYWAPYRDNVFELFTDHSSGVWVRIKGHSRVKTTSKKLSADN